MTLIEVAARLATAAHSGQTDKAGNPYIEHPAAVAGSVAAAGGTDVQQAIAWLHDVLEDTSTTSADIRSALVEVASPAVVERIVVAVEALTHERGERRSDYYIRVAANRDALVAKHADIAHNSDPVRLAVLDGPTRERLQAKYAAALAALPPSPLGPPPSRT